MHLGSELKRAIAGAVTGILYGSALAYLSIGAAGGGRGTLIPLLMSSAPISAFDLMAASYAMPVLWAMLGVLVALSGSSKGRRLAQGALLLHYVSGIALVAIYGNPQYLARLYTGKEDFLAGWLMLYLVGQVVTWEWTRSRQALR
jgi:hypothetical protein